MSRKSEELRIGQLSAGEFQMLVDAVSCNPVVTDAWKLIVARFHYLLADEATYASLSTRKATKSVFEDLVRRDVVEPVLVRDLPKDACGPRLRRLLEKSRNRTLEANSIVNHLAQRATTKELKRSARDRFLGWKNVIGVSSRNSIVLLELEDSLEDALQTEILDFEKSHACKVQVIASANQHIPYSKRDSQ